MKFRCNPLKSVIHSFYEQGKGIKIMKKKFHKEEI